MWCGVKGINYARMNRNLRPSNPLLRVFLPALALSVLLGACVTEPMEGEGDPDDEIPAWAYELPLSVDRVHFVGTCGLFTGPLYADFESCRINPNCEGDLWIGVSQDYSGTTRNYPDECYPEGDFTLIEWDEQGIRFTGDHWYHDIAPQEKENTYFSATGVSLDVPAPEGCPEALPLLVEIETD